MGTLTLPPQHPPSARQLSFAFLREPETRESQEQAQVEKLSAGASPLPEALDLATTFIKMVRKQASVSLAEWLTQAEGSSCVELRNFAASLRQDETAVAAALSTRWSNGPVEGQVNRLKMIKRTMFGRAGLPLLKARVLHAE